MRFVSVQNLIGRSLGLHFQCNFEAIKRKPIRRIEQQNIQCTGRYLFLILFPHLYIQVETLRRKENEKTKY